MVDWNKFIETGLGALSGAAAGSAFGVPGAIVGGIAGGLGALLQSDALDEQTKKLEAAAKAGDQAAKDELEYRKSIIAKLESEWSNPEYAAKSFTPQELQYMGDFMPQVSQYIQEKNPELITGLSSAREKGYQSQALSQLSGETAAKPITVQDTIQQKMKLAQQQAASAESSQRATLLRDLASRGLLGGGQEALLAAQAQQGQARGMEQVGLQAGIESAKEVEAAKQAENQRRMNAMSALGGLATSTRGQELGMETSNVNAINAFNTRAATRLQQHLDNQADTQNQAALHNLNQKQSIANENVSMGNQATLTNMSRADKIAESLANARNAKLQAQAGVMGGVATGIGQAGERAQTAAERQAGISGQSTAGNILSKAPELMSGAAKVAKGFNASNPSDALDLTDEEYAQIKANRLNKSGKGYGV